MNTRKLGTVLWLAFFSIVHAVLVLLSFFGMLVVAMAFDAPEATSNRLLNLLLKIALLDVVSFPFIAFFSVAAAWQLFFIQEAGKARLIILAPFVNVVILGASVGGLFLLGN